MILNISQPYRPPRLVTGIALLALLYVLLKVVENNQFLFKSCKNIGLLIPFSARISVIPLCDVQNSRQKTEAKQTAVAKYEYYLCKQLPLLDNGCRTVPEELCYLRDPSDRHLKQ
jgi:hypothetical protein